MGSMPTIAGGMSQALAGTPQFQAQYGVNGTHYDRHPGDGPDVRGGPVASSPPIWAPALWLLWVFPSGRCFRTLRSRRNSSLTRPVRLLLSQTLCLSRMSPSRLPLPRSIRQVLARTQSNSQEPFRWSHWPGITSVCRKGYAL
jgi:hypothetical protein